MEPSRWSDAALQPPPAAPATTSVPDVLALSFLLDHTDTHGESEADDFAQSLPHFNPNHRATHDFMLHLISCIILKALRRWVRGEVAGEDTLGPMSHSLHVGGLGTWIARQ